MEDLFCLKGRTAVITGAVGLIGMEHCRALLNAGASVAVCDIDKNACNAAADQLGFGAEGMQLDVTDINSVKEARNEIIKKFGSIDILINNAAVNDMVENPAADKELSRFENYPLELWKRSLDVNLTGIFICSQIFGAVMVSAGKGSIINISSTYGMVAPDQSLYVNEIGEQEFYKPPAYSATKGGVISFTKYLAAYWGKAGVRVNSLVPGGVENSQKEYFISNYSKRTQLGRMAQKDDYRGAVIFLASDASAYMTGASLVVDGGWTAW